MKFNLQALHLEVNIFSSFFQTQKAICLTNLNTLLQKNKKRKKKNRNTEVHGFLSSFEYLQNTS